ncbi:MAG TPA: TonB family protein [Pyrinomonadaceae bacterium]
MIRILPLLLLLAPVGSWTVAGQVAVPEADRDRAIAMVQTNPTEAIPLLSSAVKRHKKDVRAWHWLGVALEKQGNVKEALKAHERAATTAEELQDSALDNLRRLPSLELTEAAQSAERYLALKNSLSLKKRTEWRNRADFLLFHASGDAAAAKIYKNSEVTARARVVRKPEPSYTTEARNNLITGTVVLRCVFSADGRVRYINVVRGLPDGLTDRAIQAARQIKFIPAMKDGKPVSMWMQLEYNFNLY